MERKLCSFSIYPSRYLLVVLLSNLKEYLKRKYRLVGKESQLMIMCLWFKKEEQGLNWKKVADKLPVIVDQNLIRYVPYITIKRLDSTLIRCARFEQVNLIIGIFTAALMDNRRGTTSRQYKLKLEREVRFKNTRSRKTITIIGISGRNGCWRHKGRVPLPSKLPHFSTQGHPEVLAFLH